MIRNYEKGFIVYLETLYICSINKYLPLQVVCVARRVEPRTPGGIPADA